jgi:hypothetical protein
MTIHHKKLNIHDAKFALNLSKLQWQCTFIKFQHIIFVKTVMLNIHHIKNTDEFIKFTAAEYNC